MNREQIIRMAEECGIPEFENNESQAQNIMRFATLVAEQAKAEERKAIYKLVMEAPFKEFDRQEEEFDGEVANAMKAMAFSLTSAIRARGQA